MLYCLTASGLHEALGSPSGAPALAAVLASMFCQTEMEVGYIMDRGHNNAREPAKWVEGEPVRSISELK